MPSTGRVAVWRGKLEFGRPRNLLQELDEARAVA
jgi:hypothetical protein